ncbi:MAG: ABC transporter permease [Deltaproteobacteria bacterium]|nr:ABC transporter permease [Deltaproteobacteria bacterium]
MNKETVLSLTGFFQKRDNLAKIMLLLPSLGYLSFLFFYPLLRFFALSFKPYFTFENYVHFFSTSVYVQVLVRTFLISFEVTFLSFLLGYPIACLLARVSPGTRNILLIFILLPYWTSILVRSFAWMIVLGAKGVVNNFLISMGVIGAPLKLLFTNFAVVVGMVHVLLPIMVLPIYSVVIGIDSALIKASLNLGASPIKTFVKVFFPLSLPGVWSGSLLVFTIALGFFITPSLLGGRESTMLSMLIEEQAEYILNLNYAATISIILMVCTLIVVFFYNRFIGMKKIVSGAL